VFDVLVLEMQVTVFLSAATAAAFDFISLANLSGVTAG